MKFSTLAVIEKMLSSRVDELQFQVDQLREARDSRMNELGIFEWDECVDPVLLDIDTHLRALRDLLVDYKSAFNDWKGHDWS